MFHVIPHDSFLSPIHPGHLYSTYRRPLTDQELLRSLGIVNGAFVPFVKNKTEKESIEDNSSQEIDGCDISGSVRGSDTERRDTCENVTLDFQGFSPEQIQVKVKDKAVVINGEQTDGHAIVKITKSVPLPEGVEKENIHCRYVDGRVILQIPSGKKSCLEAKSDTGSEGNDKHTDMEQPKQEQKTKRCSQGDVTKSTDAKEKTFESVALDFRGFPPEQIRVKASDKAVVIYAEQTNDYSKVKVTRSVPLPEGVDRKDVRCRYVFGYVIVQIPRVDKRPSIRGKPDDKAELPDQESNPDCQRKRGMDSERRVELDKNLRNLAELFSTIFGLKDSRCDKKEEVHGDSRKESVEKSEDDSKPVGLPAEIEDTDRTDSNVIKEDVETCSEENTGCCEPASCTENQNNNQTCNMLTYDEKLRLKVEEKTRLKYEERLRLKDDEKLRIKHQVDDSGKCGAQEADDKSSVDEASVNTQDGSTDCMTSFLEDEKEDGSLQDDNNNQTMSVSTEPKLFKLEFDLSNYEPDDVRVIFKDGDVIFEAQREIKGDNYCEKEKLSRRIRLPENVEESMLKSFLSPQGLITVQAPYKIMDQSSETIKVEIMD